MSESEIHPRLQEKITDLVYRALDDAGLSGIDTDSIEDRGLQQGYLVDASFDGTLNLSDAVSEFQVADDSAPAPTEGYLMIHTSMQGEVYVHEVEGDGGLTVKVFPRA